MAVRVHRPAIPAGLSGRHDQFIQMVHHLDRCDGRVCAMHISLSTAETRRFVCRSAAGISIVLTSCGGPVPARSTRTRSTIIISAQELDGYSDALLAAWRRRPRPFDVAFRPIPGPVEQVAKQADIVTARGVRSGTSAPLRPLFPYLKQSHINLGELVVPLRAFEDYRGILRGLPLIVGEVQFYVNSRAVHAAKVPVKPAITFSGIRQLTEFVRQRSSRPLRLIGGMGWGSLNFWAAFVRASGGQVLDANGLIDLSGSLDATASLVALARAARWDPSHLSPKFAREGFDGTAALFAFYQPWTIGMAGKRGQLAVQSMRPDRFPSGISHVVPAFGDPVGLGISQHSQHPDQAAQVLAWLYRERQQRLLANMGVPPVIKSAPLSARWRTLQASNPSLPRFDLSGYFDFQSMLPFRIFRTKSNIPLAGQYQFLFMNAFRRAYSGESLSSVWADLRSSLARAQPVG